MISKSKSVSTTTVGYMCLALTGWMISMPNASWFSKLYGHGHAMMYPLAIVLGVMGILSFLQSRGLDTIIFLVLRRNLMDPPVLLRFCKDTFPEPRTAVTPATA
jgi:hypothetical protein